MRRKDREQSEQFARELLTHCEYATLATVNADGTPYCVAVSPAVVGESIYFHSAMAGQKLENLRNNSAVCISCVGATELEPKTFSTKYESAVATGRCEMVAEGEEKTAALRAICEKYAHSNMSAFEQELQKSLTRTAVCKITIETLTGKAKR